MNDFRFLVYFLSCEQGCSESSAGVAAYPWSDVAFWHLGPFLHRHGIHFHPSQLSTGTQTTNE